MIEDISPSMKIIVVGNGKVHIILIYLIFNIQVGKTTLTIKFAKNIYTTEYKKTLGVDFLNTKKYIKSIDKEVDYYIWDTAGQDYYNAITRRYYKGADAALIVFSIIDKDSFDSIKSWHEKVVTECGRIPTVLVMSKIDLKDEAIIKDKEAVEKAKELNLNLMKVSSKDGTMVNEVFERLAIEHFNSGGVSHGADDIENVNNNKLHVKGGGEDDVKELEDIEKKKSNKDGNKEKEQSAFKLSTDVHIEEGNKKKSKKCCK